MVLKTSSDYLPVKHQQTAGKKVRILGWFLELNFNGNTCFRYTAEHFNRC
jgi:hypothetical protein